jgi:predicted dehydrogenase
MNRPDPAAAPLRLAVVGYGWFAELLHDRVVPGLAGMDVVAAVDPSPERRQLAQSRGLAAAATLDELVATTPLDAVAVLTPHDTHRELVTAAAGHGLHVFCEKAMAVGSQDCVAMIRACREAGVVLVVGHMQKLFGAHRRAVELARSGALGEVRSVFVDGAHWCPVFPGWWRSAERCGGLLYWTGIHDLDTMRAMVGAEARTAYAVTAPAFDDYTDYEDVVAATVVYDNGAVGTISVAEQWPLLGFEESFEIRLVLTAGGIRVLPAQAAVEHATRTGHERGDAVRESFGSFAEMEEEAYSLELEDFVRAVREGRLDHASAVDGLRCVETLEAVYRSVASGRVEPVVRHDVGADPVTAGSGTAAS